MLPYDQSIKDRATNLRKSGYSVGQISKLLKISQGTSSLWVRSVALNSQALKRIEQRKMQGRINSIKTLKMKRQKMINKFNSQASDIINKIPKNKDIYKVLLALLFWTEGSKRTSFLSFTNSDPTMARTYTNLIRRAFKIDEKKFRIIIHIHEYHDEEKVKYWSNVTRIPLQQFTKCYLKPHTAKRKHLNYMGCANIKYFDYEVALELKAIYTMLARSF